MILILSTEILEESTNAIIDWLEYYNADFIRINGQDIEYESHLKLILDKKEPFKIGSIEIIPEKIQVVWYRRWGNITNLEMENKLSSITNIEGLKGYMRSEYKGISNSFFSLFSHAYWLSDPPDLRIDDKARSLMLAQSIGINIPYSFITNRKEDIIAYLEKNNNALICKSIVNTKKIKFDSETFTMYTEEINEKKLKGIPDFFSYTFSRKNR